MLDGGEWELEGELCTDVGIQMSSGHGAGDEVSHVADVAVRLLHQCEVVANTIPAHTQHGSQYTYVAIYCIYCNSRN